jgi:hypothetical protein
MARYQADCARKKDGVRFGRPPKNFRLPLGSRRMDRDAIRRTCSMSVPRLLSLSLKFTPIRRFFAQHTRLTQKEACRLIR